MGGPADRDPWYVYVVECGDGSLYTGIARDVERRVAQHNDGKGAKYTRGRGPVKVLVSSPGLARGEALVLEAAAKRKQGSDKLDAVRAGLAKPRGKPKRAKSRARKRGA